MAEKTEIYFDEDLPMSFLDKYNIFKKKTKAIVSTTMFIDHTGDQYPIRNITSVKIKYNMSKFVASLCKWLGILIFAIGLITIFTNTEPEGITGSYIITFVGFVFLVIWSNAKVSIKIGAGGKEEPSKAHWLGIKGSEDHVKRLATAINNAISELQNK